MSRSITRRRFAAALGLAAAAPLAARLAASGTLAAETGAAGSPGGAPVVVELFTSQGCNSCPPADRYLGELATRPDVVPLAYHVDYWDYIGWKDPWADPAFTERQRYYAPVLGRSTIYTPQMVVGGRDHAVGSHRAKVENLLQTLRPLSGQVRVTLTSELALLEGALPEGMEETRVLAAVYLSRADTAVARGENAGKTLAEYNIVRALASLGTFEGGTRSYPLDLGLGEGRDAFAVIVQHVPSGAILGAAKREPGES